MCYYKQYWEKKKGGRKSVKGDLLGDKVKEALTEVKMSGMRKRYELDDQRKTYERTDRVTVLGTQR